MTDPDRLRWWEWVIVAVAIALVFVIGILWSSPWPGGIPPGSLP